MKTSLALAFGILVTATSALAQISYSNTADIAKETSNVRISDARYFEVATRTEVRDIPGCYPGGEAGNICTEVVVLERTPVVEVIVSFRDANRDPEMPEGYVTFNFDVSEFDAQEIASLKKASRLWSLSGAKVRKAFSKKFSLENKLAARTIQVVDVRNSRLCPIGGETGEPAPNCQETIVYKPAQTIVRELTLNKK